MNRRLMEKTRATLHYNAVESRWWAEAINCAAYLMNRLPAAAHKMTPHERWTGERPDLGHLRGFGSKGFAQTPKERRSKLDANGFRCVFVGYSTI
ncbi:polyprotein [Phytophthora megakarya]|uniref:Polyprotein n=1 Tax=Phytophthora megakarya TaxID=4795 RepID=A0A225UZ17_9STRA|nr:polyprotein [Phytophthora megakarya]